MTEQTAEPGNDRLTLEVSRDGWTNGIQLSINKLDERMSIERLPQWIGGDADTWQREGGE